MDVPARVRWLKALGAVGTVALVVSAPAPAKFAITITASDTTPNVGQSVSVIVSSERAIDHDLRLIAVAPGRSVFRVVATITADTMYPLTNVARHGFEIPLTRIGPKRWRGVVRFDRRGRWRVVVPNFGPVGVIGPNGAALVTLAVHAPASLRALWFRRRSAPRGLPASRCRR